MTVDAELVTRKLLLVTRDLPMLASIRARGRESYLTSPVDQAVVERHLERMIGRMIDVNYHLLTESGEPPPSDYYASFVQLSGIGVLPCRIRPASCRLDGTAKSHRARV
jgi:uncharacterized protein YutE (UPF0331/DUF86 family)